MKPAQKPFWRNAGRFITKVLFAELAFWMVLGMVALLAALFQ